VFRKLILVSILWMLPLSFLDVGQGGGLAYAADAQPAAKKKKQQTRKVPAMREKTYKAIAEAQAFIEADTALEALPVLNKLLQRRGLNDYEIAQVWNMLAFAYYTLDDMPNTISSYEEVLKQAKITLALELGTLRSLFQLYYQAEKYRKSIAYIDRWLKLNEMPDSGILYLKATAFYQLDDFQESLTYAKQVVSVAESQQKTVKENWLYLLVILYNEVKDYDNVIVVLERLIVEFPKKQYWMHLAGLYAEKVQEENALAAYYAAYVQGMLTRESEVIMLAQRLLNAEVPYEAAVVVQAGIDSDLVKKDEKNMKLLAQSWTMSQDTDKAIKAWTGATEFAEDGEIFYRLAQAQANDDQHKNAVKSYRAALKQGDLNKPRDVEFWMGISLMQLESWDDATKAFRGASKDKKKAKQCKQYIRYIKGEKRRQEELRKMLEASL
jgi:tetratricopeptide (TPR) repeat protein